MKHGRSYSIVLRAITWAARDVFRYRPAGINEMPNHAMANQKILNLGCDTGYMTKFIKGNVPLPGVCGADTNKYAIRIARRK
jgi:trans-aconitate methyltransferase